MKCQQVQTMLEELTLPRLRAGKYQTLQLHVQYCAGCQPLWNQWRDHEQQLIELCTIEQAPAGLWEHIMTNIDVYETANDHAALWRAVTLKASSQGLQHVVLHDPTQQDATEDQNPGTVSSLMTRARTQVAEYFRGERVIFQIPVDLSHCSDFERAVLAATETIPYGEVRSYKWIAERIGRPRATRAVGNALHKNPVPIVIPCHRVVKSDGSMGGYAFGEAWKTRLLALERDTIPFVGCASTRILCYRGCHHERRIRDHNRIHFAHLDEALGSGYRPCTVCQPGNDSH